MWSVQESCWCSLCLVFPFQWLLPRNCALFRDVSEEDDLVASLDGREDVAELTAKCFLDFILRVEGGSVSTDKDSSVSAVYQLDR